MKLYNDDCLTILREMESDSIDAIVTDPPYGLSKPPDMAEVLQHWLDDREYNHKSKGFMGAKWDSFVPSPVVWRECLRVLKPGGHILVFAVPKTQDLMGVSLRLAGFEPRECIIWIFGSGFSKSHNIGKAIDRAAGAEREVVRVEDPHYDNAKRQNAKKVTHTFDKGRPNGLRIVTAPATEAAKQWEGWGTALKPAYESVLMMRKPFKGTVAANVLKYGTGAINIDDCRVETRSENESGWSKTGSKASDNRAMSGANYDREAKDKAGQGRFPANLILTYPENEYKLRDDVKPDQLIKLAEWMNQNTQQRQRGDGMHAMPLQDSREKI